MSETIRLPEGIERDLTLVHADTCTCTIGEEVTLPQASCAEVRATLRREIAAAEFDTAADIWESVRGLCRSCTPTDGILVIAASNVASLRARADAIREGRDA